MNRTENTTIDAVRQVMRCNVCGDEIPIPLGQLKWVCAVMSAFERAHRGRQHMAGMTRFTSSESEVAGKYHELLYAVTLKHPGKTRHETALRYIRRAEEPSDTGAKPKRNERLTRCRTDN